MNLKDKAVNIKGKEYVLVSDRILAFNEMYSSGYIQTELLSNPQDDRIVIKAMISPDGERVFTGHAQEVIGDGFINKTSAMENAETSAIGRALGMMGIGIIESVASVDEINKAKSSEMTTEQAVANAKIAIEKTKTMEELEKVEENIKNSKIIPNRRSNEGKAIRSELSDLVGIKSQYFIDNGATPFN